MLQFQLYLAAPDFWRWTSLPVCFVQSNIWATFLGRFTDATCVSRESDFPLKDFLQLPDPPLLLLLLPWEMQAVKRSIHKKWQPAQYLACVIVATCFRVCAVLVFLQRDTRSVKDFITRDSLPSARKTSSFAKELHSGLTLFHVRRWFCLTYFLTGKKITTMASEDLSEHMQHAVWGWSQSFLSYILDKPVAADESMCN